jgi:sialidase-1
MGTDDIERVVTEFVTVARDDSIYECFPDMTRAPGGDLIVVYRESESHEGHQYTRIVTRHSSDEGVTWSDRQIVIEGPTAGGPGPYLKYNCAKIATLLDGRVAIAVDEQDLGGEGGAERWRDILIWWSDDDGDTWSEPQRIPGDLGLPDIFDHSDGTLILSGQMTSEKTGKLTWHCHRSEDGGATWSERITIADDGAHEHCEGGVVELPGGELVCYMRENSHQGWPGFKCISRDSGRTWAGPFPTLMAGCERPQPGMLDSGDVLVTYRSNMRGVSYGKENQFAYMETAESALEPERNRQQGRIIALDHDTNPVKPDTGYSGWEQLADGRILCVYYIKREAPMAYIRGRFFSQEDFTAARA